jgi:P-type Ca2+ transporter type 2C
VSKTVPEVSVAHARVPGRLRLRCAALLRDRAAAARLEAQFAGMPGVRRAEVRAASGSVLLRFDPAHDWQMWRDSAWSAIAAALDPDAGSIPRSISEPPPIQPPATGGTPWHGLPLDDLIERLAGDPDRGLGHEAAERTRIRTGPNVMPQEAPPPRLALLARQVASLPVAMLGASSVVSMATGRPIEAVATLSVVGANAVLGYVTEGQAEHSIAALMGASDQPVTVVRDGREVRLRSADLVPGDLYRFRAGEQIMADARLVRAERLHIDESALTGETLPVAKDPGAAPDPGAPIGTHANMVHAGTLVAEGQGAGVVVDTGARTEAARIALVSQTGTRPQAPVEVELDALARVLSLGALAACGVFLGVGLLRGYRPSEIVGDALALAVAAVPEGLPTVATSTMAMALRRMEKRGILIRNMRAVEGLGALHTLCLDKTGTLTQNRMSVVAAIAGMDDADPGDSQALERVLRAAVLNNDTDLTGQGPAAPSPTENALISFAEGHGLDRAALCRGHPRLDTIERRAGRPWMATLHGGRGPGVLVKGAPEAVLRMCTRVRDGARSRPLTAADRDLLMARNDAMAARPARVLGFAEGKRPVAGEDIGGLTWLGALGMADPLRPGAASFVAAMRRAGIETVMITGDQAATAVSIARELGLGRDGTVRVMDSTELSGLAPELLAALVLRTDVFARVSAQQKLAIVKALQAGGRIVGMTGDGVNDGPALKAADIGIAMGESGTDLARDVANVVIRDDRLETLGEAVAEGRAAYGNIRRALGFLITTNLSEIAVEIVEALHGPGEVETPMELLWINLVTDILPGLGIAMARAEDDMMERPPRDPDEPIVRPGDFRRMGLDGATISAAALAAHFVGMKRHGPGPETRGMTFLALSLGQLLYTLVAQRRDITDLKLETLFANRALDAAMAGSIGLAVLPFFVPGLRKVLGIAPLRPADIGVSVAAGLAPSVIVLGRRALKLQLEEIERHR